MLCVRWVIRACERCVGVRYVPDNVRLPTQRLRWSWSILPPNQIYAWMGIAFDVGIPVSRCRLLRPWLVWFMRLSPMIAAPISDGRWDCDERVYNTILSDSRAGQQLLETYWHTRKIVGGEKGGDGLGEHEVYPCSLWSHHFVKYSVFNCILQLDLRGRFSPFLVYFTGFSPRRINSGIYEFTLSGPASLLFRIILSSYYFKRLLLSKQQKLATAYSIEIGYGL